MLRAFSRRKMVDIAVQPHVIACGLLADLVFIGCFIPCELAVINTTAYVQTLLLGVLHVATSCLHWEIGCPLPVILCTGYCKQCPFSTPSVSSFSLPLHHRLALLATSPVATGEAKIGNPRKGTETGFEMPRIVLCCPYLRTRTPQGVGAYLQSPLPERGSGKVKTEDPMMRSG